MKARVEVSLANSRRASIDFLVDTGADKTIIHPRDAQKLGVSYADLQGHPCEFYTKSLGIGGESPYLIVQARLTFPRVSHVLEARIGPSSKDAFMSALTNDVPSLIGRDLLNIGALSIDHIRNIIRLDMHQTEELRLEQHMRTRSPQEYRRYRERL